MRRLLALLTGATLSVASVATAQSLTPSALPPMGTTGFILTSPSMGVTYEIAVRAPRAAANASGAKFAALIVTDGYRTMFPAADAASSLEAQDVIEPMFIVSIGVPIADGDALWTSRRIYEFSTDWDMNDPFGKAVAGYCTRFNSPPGKCIGGAPKFLAVIVDELIPELAKRFPIDTTKLGLYGWDPLESTCRHASLSIL